MHGILTFAIFFIVSSFALDKIEIKIDRAKLRLDEIQ